MPVAPSKSFLRHSSKRLLVTSNCGLTSNKLQQIFFHRHSIEGGPISNTLKDPKVRSVERVKHDELLPPGTQVSRNSHSQKKNLVIVIFLFKFFLKSLENATTLDVV